MSFTIYSGMPGHVVSVQVDEFGAFNVIGQGQAHALLVPLRFAQVHVAGLAPNQQQAPRLPGIDDGSRFEVTLLNNAVRITPRP